MSSKGALVVIGSGPGIGRSTARYFADKGSKHIVLLSRDESRLAEDAKFVTSAASGVKVDTFKIDVSADEVSVKRSLSNVDDSLKTAGVRLEVVLYNAARVAPSKIMEWDAKGLEDDLKVSRIGVIVLCDGVFPRATELTNLKDDHRHPFPFLFSLSAGKAAQHNPMHSFHKKYEPQIHIACVPVGGFVRDDAKVTSARAVAAEFWKLYEQPKGKEGKVSVEMEDPDYQQTTEGFRKQVESS